MVAIPQIPFVFPSADGAQYQVLARTGSAWTIGWGDYLRTTEAGLIFPTLAGNAAKYPKVNATADGFEFSAIDFSGVVPYSGATTAVVLGAHTLSTTSGLISPKLYPAADSTTALQINKANGTTNVLNVDTTNGRVGIGTTGPNAPLHIQGSDSITLRIERTSTTYGSQFVFMTDNTTKWNFKGGYTSGLYDLAITPTSGTPAMLIQQGGNVGIGTTEPNRTLHLAKSAASLFFSIERTSTNTSALLLGAEADFTSIYSRASDTIATGVPLKFIMGSTEVARILANGKVGIGTTTPTAVLHLKAGTATANTAPFKFTSGTLLTTPEAGAQEFLTDDFYATITTAAARKAFVLDDGARLTSGRIPAATTNGRLVDGPTPAADNTYASPTSITISKGLITAIS